MNNLYLLLAQRGADSAGNQWLGEHPMVLGGIFLAIGLVAGGWGIVELKSGVASDKRGRKVEGGAGKALAIVRIVVGAGACLFGLYKMVAG